MTDQYRIAPSQTADAPAGDHRRDMLRPVLWLLLILSAAANAALSFGPHTLVRVGAGLITLASGVSLVVRHYRHRTR